VSVLQRCAGLDQRMNQQTGNDPPGMIAFTKSSVWCSRRWQASAVVPSSQSTKVMPVALCRFHGPKLLLLMADDHDRPEVE